MTEAGNKDWEIAVFVPGAAPVAVVADPAKRHSLTRPGPVYSRVMKIKNSEVEGQWTRTVDALMNLSSTVASRTKEWDIEEIEVGMTLSAKGELLFIAEAGAEASIKFTLKKKTGGK